jgi:hypothetical protein
MCLEGLEPIGVTEAPDQSLSSQARLVPVTEADHLLQLEWPPEGLSLAALVQKLVSPSSWSVMREFTGECLSPRLKAIAKGSLVGLCETDRVAEPVEPSARALFVRSRSVSRCSSFGTLAHSSPKDCAVIR